MEFTVDPGNRYFGNIFVSMGAFIGMSVEEAIEASRPAGIDFIELSSGARYKSPDLLKALHPYQKQGMQFIVHNYFPVPAEPFVLNLASADEDNLARSMEHCRKAIDLTAKLNAPFYSVHSGFCINASPGDLGRKLTGKRIERDKALEIFVTSLMELADYARSKNTGLVIENNVLSSRNLDNGENTLLLGVTAADICEITRQVNRENLGVLLDVAHLKVSAKTLGFSAEQAVADMAEWIVACHLSDNDGLTDSNEMVSEDSWFWEPLVASLKKPPVWVLEAYNLDIDSIASQVSLIESKVDRLKPSLLCAS